MRTWYSRGIWSGFELVFRPWMHRRLSGIHIRGLDRTTWLPTMPVMLVANHVSWWDGFLLREVHRRLRPDAPLHVVMLETELRRVPIFRGMGAIPLPAGPMGARTIARDLALRIERRPDAVIGYFPQGRIWPSHRRPLGFRRGGAWLAGRLAPVAVVPVGLHFEPLTLPGPAAFVSVGSPLLAREALEPGRLEGAVTGQVDEILGWVQRHGEDSVEGWREAA
jgi:1-acyl-sn-glycerol-3-phosphate acyltransferase